MNNKTKDLVKKSNKMTEGFYSLSVSEYRILHIAFTALVDLPKEHVSTEKHMEIRITDYMKMYEVDRKTAYEALELAGRKLYKRELTYQDAELGEVLSRWVNKVHFNKKTHSIGVWLSHDVLSMVSELKEKYTYFNLKNISDVNSIYALRVYEMLMQWRSTQKTPVIPLQDFRKRLGIEDDQYTRMYDFKKYVLERAIEQINQNTDVKASYQQHKDGRTITGFSFSFKYKTKAKKTKVVEQNKDENTPDMFAPFSMTEKQRLWFARQLAEVHELSDRAKTHDAKRSYDAFAKQIADELLIEEHQAFYKPYLEKLGFTQ